MMGPTGQEPPVGPIGAPSDPSWVQVRSPVGSTSADSLGWHAIRIHIPCSYVNFGFLIFQLFSRTGSRYLGTLQIRSWRSWTPNLSSWLQGRCTWQLLGVSDCCRRASLLLLVPVGQSLRLGPAKLPLWTKK